MFRRSATLATVLTAAAIAAAPAPAAPAREPSHLRAVAAATCRAGYRSATIDGRHKCLHTGEFCRRAADAQYRRYGFRCVRYYANVGRYRLTRA